VIQPIHQSKKTPYTTQSDRLESNQSKIDQQMKQQQQQHEKVVEITYQ